MMNALVVRCFALACTLALMVGPASAQQAAPADPAMGQSVEVAAMSDSMVKANQERAAGDLASRRRGLPGRAFRSRDRLV